ncbi:hypothetical protein [Amycolatopsis alba]|nr:hypothetical protein [Amycolatopsis alba]
MSGWLDAHLQDLRRQVDEVRVAAAEGAEVRARDQRALEAGTV